MEQAVALVTATAVAWAIVALALWTSPKVRWRQRLGRSVVVHLSDDHSLSGVLVGQARDGLVLDAATLMDTGQGLAGKVLVEWSKVSFIQLLGRE